MIAFSLVLALGLTIVPAADLSPPTASASLCEDVQCQVDRAKDCIRQAGESLQEKDYVGAVACEQPA